MPNKSRGRTASELPSDSVYADPWPREIWSTLSARDRAYAAVNQAERANNSRPIGNTISLTQLIKFRAKKFGNPPPLPGLEVGITCDGFICLIKSGSNELFYAPPNRDSGPQKPDYSEYPI